jgi:hypothetical protein
MITIRIVFGLIIVGIILLLTVIQHKKSGKPFPWNWVRYAIGAVVLVIALLYGKSWYTGRAEAEKAEAAKADSVKVAQRRQNVPALQQDWTFETYEQLSKKGLRVYLFPGWKSFPTGGPIDIKTPGGIVTRQYPGTDITDYASPTLLRSIEQKGWYTFFPNPPGSERGVIVFNCWTCQQRP